LDLLATLERDHPGAAIVGSVVAAQACPGRVFSLVPVPGLERVPADQNRCRSDAFGTFEQEPTKFQNRERMTECFGNHSGLPA